MTLGDYPAVSLLQAREQQFAARKSWLLALILWRSGRLLSRCVEKK
jgi:hypothetical protein